MRDAPRLTAMNQMFELIAPHAPWVPTLTEPEFTDTHCACGNPLTKDEMVDGLDCTPCRLPDCEDDR